MATQSRFYAPTPEKIVEFIKLQVTDAALDNSLFPEGAPRGAFSLLFALGLLSVIPPVPNNRAILDDTFTHIQNTMSGIAPSEYTYNEIVIAYNRYLGVFLKSAGLPKRDPFGNPYEQTAKAAAYELGFPEDGARIFHLTTWMNHYCKDAIALFYARQAQRKSPAANRGVPTPEKAYSFVSRHVNNTVTDPTFFTEKPPSNATEVFTALYLQMALFVPSQDGQLVYRTPDYTTALLDTNNNPPMVFEKIVQGMESFSATVS